MMRYVFLILFLTANICYSQKEKIKLPKGDREIKISKSRITPIVSIYIDKNETIFFENEKVTIEDISRLFLLYKYSLNEEDKMFIKIFLYLDERISYEIVDRIKTRLANAYGMHIIYKTNSIEDKNILKGIYFRCHPSIYRFKEIEKQITKKEAQENEKLLESIDDNMSMSMIPPPPPIYWAYDIMYRIYSLEQNVINESLNDKNYQCANLSDNGIEFGAEIISLNNKEEIKKILSDTDLIMLKFDSNLKYATYFEFLQTYKAIESANQSENKSTAFIIELSSELLDAYRRKEINFCN